MDSTQSLTLTELAERTFPRRWPAYLKMVGLVEAPFELPEHQERRLDRLVRENTSMLQLDENFPPIDRPALWDALETFKKAKSGDTLKAWLVGEARTKLTRPLFARYKKYAARLAMTIPHRLSEILTSPGITVFGRCAGSREQLMRADLLDAAIDIVGNTISKGGQKWHSVDVDVSRASSTLRSGNAPTAPNMKDPATWLVTEIMRRKAAGEPHERDDMLLALGIEYDELKLSKEERRALWMDVPEGLRKKEKQGRPLGSRKSGPK